MSPGLRRCLLALITVIICLNPVLGLASPAYRVVDPDYPQIIDEALLRHGLKNTTTYAGRDAQGNYLFKCVDGGEVVFTPAWVNAAEEETRFHEHDELCVDASAIGDNTLLRACPCLATVKVVVVVVLNVYTAFCLCREIYELLVAQGWITANGTATQYVPYEFITADIINGQVYYR